MRLTTPNASPLIYQYLSEGYSDAAIGTCRKHNAKLNHAFSADSDMTDLLAWGGASAVRRQGRNLATLYNRAEDPLCELAQNAFKSINRQIQLDTKSKSKAKRKHKIGQNS